MVNVSTDREFADAMDRAARTLFSAVHSARTQGLSVADVRRIALEAIQAAEHLEITRASAARAAAIDHVPDGTPLPEPQLRVVPATFDEHGLQAVPSIHPMFDEQRRAA